MPKGPAAGYIYFIKDPRLTAQGEKDIIFVSNSLKPWEAVRRHLEGSTNVEMVKWVKGLLQDFPNGVEILTNAVVDLWEDPYANITLPPPTPGMTRLEWGVVDREIDENARLQQDGIDHISLGTKKTYWIKRLQAAGHPLLNAQRGRPGKVEEESVASVEEVN